MPFSHLPYQGLPVLPYGLPMMPSFKSLVPSINYVPSTVSGYALITNSDAAGQDLTIGSVQKSTIINIILTLAGYSNKLQVFFIVFSADFHTHGP